VSAVGLFEGLRVLERLGAEGRVDAAPAAWRAVKDEAVRVLDTIRDPALDRFLDLEATA
jgi:hypothetical protein